MAAAAKSTNGTKFLIDDPAFARRLAEIEIEINTIELSVLRALTEDTGPATVSALKILCTECAQHVTELFIELSDRNAIVMLDRRSENWASAAPLVPEFCVQAIQSYLFERAQTIYGGATEIQKNIIWRHIGA